MKLFLFPKGTVIPVIVLFFTLCQFMVIGSNAYNPKLGGLAPYALNSVVLSDTSANLFWSTFNVPKETQWDLEIVRKGTPFSGTPTHFGITTGLTAFNPFFIDSLQHSTDYEYKVRAICSGVPSAWSNETRAFFTHILNGDGCGIDFEIPDLSCNNPIRYPIQVKNEPDTILGVDVVLQEVNLIIEHDWLVDLEIWLESPSGQQVRLIDENGGIQNNLGDPVDSTCTNYLSLLNANACNEIPIFGANPPLTGRFLPLGNLNAFNDNSNPNDGPWFLIICDDAAPNVGSLKFVELVFEPVICTPPTGLVALDIDSTSVTFDWAQGGSCDSTIFEYGPPGFTPGIGAGTTVTAACPPYVLTGLTGGSDYDFYIFESCGGGITAQSCREVSLTTDCSPPPATVASDFDNLPSCIGISCINPCDIDNYFWHNARNEKLEWSVFQNGTSTSGTGPTTDVSGTGKYIYMEVNSLGGICSPGDEAILMSNCMRIDTKNTDTCHVSFNYHMFGSSIGTLKFQITTDGINWMNLWSKSGNQGNQWNDVKLSLSSYNGMNAQFRFVGSMGIGNGSKGDIGLDEINFYGSVENNSPQFTFYVDNDGDGFGDALGFVQNCFNFMPGFVTNNLDCNDSNPLVSDSTPEIPCNGIDENCSGLDAFGRDDDHDIPPPNVNNTDTICEGEIFDLVAIPNYGGNIFWYDANFNFFPGDTLNINGLAAINGAPTTYHYFAYEESGPCSSPDSAWVNVVVNPLPIISTQEAPVICQGEVFDLSTLQINDQNNTVGPPPTFHTGFPANSSNMLASPLVSPIVTQDYYIKKEASGGCEDTTMVTITVLLSPIANIAPSQDTFETCKGNPVYLNSYESSGLQNYDQLWNTFETTNQIIVNSSGVSGNTNLVTFTVTGPNQCSNTDSIVIKTVSSVDTVDVPVPVPVSSCFGNDGLIFLNPRDGVPDYHYTWSGPSPGSATASGSYAISNLLKGSYSVTISDDSPEGCDFILNNIVVDGPSATVLLDSIQPTSCFGATDGGIFLSVSGSNPTIAWSGGITSTSDDVTGLAAGFYNVTVTDSGCQTVLPNIEVPQPEDINALSNPKNVDCFGDASGAIDLMVTGGTPNYSFVWNNAAPVQNPSGLPSGDYYYTITDSQGCTFESDTISISEPSSLSLSVSQIVMPLCFGDANGSIDVIASGGASPYQYFWSDNGVGASRSGLLAGSYDVTVMDANGCQNVQTNIMVDNPPKLTVNATQVTNASCFGIDDGAIDMTASGGVGILGYIWNTGDGTEDLSGLAGGAYVLTVIDGNSCRTISDTIEIAAPNNLIVDRNITEPFCVGTSDGKIDLEILSGGTSPYTFLWSDSTTNEDLTNVPVGFYDVTITHANGCISTFTKIKVDAPQVIDGNNVESLSPRCYGESSGRILSSIRGGTRPYNYNWINGMSTQDIGNLASGFYALTVTDANNCQLEIDSIEIVENDSLMVEILAVDQILCHDDSTGGITVQASGGNPIYTYSWNGGTHSGANISGLAPGNYNLTITDSVNCVLDNIPTIVIDNPPLIDVNYQISLDPDCSGGLNRDTIKLAASGGIGNLNFLWSDGSNGTNLTNIPAGEYEVTVTDDNNCQLVVDEIKVPNIASSFYFKNSAKADVSCFGNGDGSICIPYTGGIPPYQYSWSDGAGGSGGTDITNDTMVCLTNEEEGTYILTVVDSKGCVIESQPIQILEPKQLNIEILDRQDVFCAGGSNGEIVSSVSGGNPPYDFAWVDTQTGDSILFTESASSFPAGNYILKVKDDIGCTTELSGPVTIFEPDPITLDSIEIEHVQCFEDSTGKVDFKIFGGTAPVNPFWGNGVDPNNLSVGTYTVTVVDDNNCILTPNPVFTINGPTSPLMFDNITGTDPTCHDDTDGQIAFLVSGGMQPYQYFRDGTNFLINPIAENLPAGTFEIMVRDSNQCESSVSVTLNNPPELEITIDEKPVSMNIGNDGELTVTATGGVGGYQYLWSNDSTTQTITGLVVDWYFVTVTDGVGCEEVMAFELDFTNSVNELEIDGDITFSPNPTDGLIKVDFDLNSFQNFQYFVINQEGKAIQKNKVDVLYRTSLELDLTTFPSGTFYFVLQKDNAWKSWKVTKI